MSFPEGFVATDFIIPSDELKKDYFITGRDCHYVSPDNKTADWKLELSFWKQIINTSAPLVYKIFDDNNCWVSDFTSTSNKDFLDFKFAIYQPTHIYLEILRQAKNIIDKNTST